MAASDRYSKVQLVNYLRTGDLNTASAITDVNAAVSRMIDYAIAHNPTAAYAFIKKQYGTDFLTLTSGTEFQEETQDSMSRFLLGKTNKLSDDDKLKFVYTVFNAIPTNPTINNWTVPTN